jgi:hypothetical protein
MGRSTFSGPIKSTNGIEVGSSGTQITTILKGSVAVNPASLADGAEADTSITITGAVVGDIVVLNPPTDALDAGIIVGQAHVSAADTVKVRIHNNSGGTVDVASGTWYYLLIRS